MRKELYEWWAGIRYAIDWKALADARRSRGRACLARFPRYSLRAKVYQLLEDHAYATLLSGAKAESFIPTSEWFRGWEEDYGLSMRRANRKYEVARPVVKERFEIFLITLYRIRLFIFKRFGCWPEVENSDQSPYHNNETGSQNKPVLGVRGSKIPIIEGNDDVKTRWTANLTTFSDIERISRGDRPYCELCFRSRK